MVISTASYSNPTGLLEKNSLPRCNHDCDTTVTGEWSLVKVQLSRAAVYVVAVVIGAGVAVVAAVAVVVAAVNMDTVVVAAIAAAIVVAVLVAAMVVQSKLGVAVVVVGDGSKSMVWLSTTATWFIDVNSISVIGDV